MSSRHSTVWMLSAICLLLVSGTTMARKGPSTILGVLEQNRHTTTLAAGLKTYPAVFNAAITNTNTAVTVFAPTNEALRKVFKALGISGFTASNTVLADVLKYHIVPQIVTHVRHGQVFNTLLSGATLTIDVKASSKVVVRGRNSDATIVSTVIKAGKSRIYLIDDVLLPINPFPVPYPNVAAAAVGAKLNSLVAAVQKAGLTTTLSNPDLEVTVFAPTDRAFAAAFKKLRVTLDTIPVATLTKILQYHVVPGYRTSFNLLANQQLDTLLTGQKLRVKYIRPFHKNSLRIQAFGSLAKVLIPNVFAGKSVVHVVDTVLIPNLK